MATRMIKQPAHYRTLLEAEISVAAHVRVTCTACVEARPLLVLTRAALSEVGTVDRWQAQVGHEGTLDGACYIVDNWPLFRQRCRVHLETKERAVTVLKRYSEKTFRSKPNKDEFANLYFVSFFQPLPKR